MPRDLFSVDYRDSIRNVVRKELKDKYGIKIPKIKVRDKHKNLEDCQKKGKVFGVLLGKAPSKNIKDDQYFAIPVFLLDALNYLNDHLSTEGLFRKSGSAGRQKILKDMVERDGSFSSCDFLHPHDIASLVKQFFRELLDPLFTTQFSPSFMKCLTLTNNDTISALQLCTLLLQDEHLCVLKYLVNFISELSNHSQESKMTIKNLAIVFAPNLMCTSGKDRNSEKSMKETTQIVDLVFSNPSMVGMVPDALFNKASTVDINGGGISSSGDEIDIDMNRRGRTMEVQDEKKRDRSKSITGFLRRNFKPNDKNSKATINDAYKDVNGIDIPSQNWVIGDYSPLLGKKSKNNSSSSISSNGSGSSKRHINTKTNLTPVKKSPRLDEENRHPNISYPTLRTMCNQVAVTPKNKFHSMEVGNLVPLDKPAGNVRSKDTPILPSKFDLTRARNQRSFSMYHHTRSKQNTFNIQTTEMEIDGNIEEPRLPPSRLSRATQKPHVKKRRASSLDRRRARYQTGTPGRTLPKTPLLDREIPPFCSEEDLNLNLAYVADESVAMDTDTNFMCVPIKSRIPIRKTSNLSSKRITKKSSSNPDIQSKKSPDKSDIPVQNSRKNSTNRRRVKKSLSSVDHTRTNRILPDPAKCVRKKVSRTTSAVPRKHGHNVITNHNITSN